MTWVTLNSTCIERVGYDHESGEMHIEFVSGGEVEYEDVPEDHFTGICDANSPGRYWHEHLKGRY